MIGIIEVSVKEKLEGLIREFVVVVGGYRRKS